MVSGYSSTSWAARTGNRKSRRASLPPIRTTVKPVAVTSAFKVTTTGRSHFETFASGFCHERTRASLCDDVPPVFHLGSLVRNHGHVPWPDPAFHRWTDRGLVRSDSLRRDSLAVLHGNRRRSLFLERKTACNPASDRRGCDVSRVAADRFRLVLPAPDSVRSLLHADAVAHQFHLVPSREGSWPRFSVHSSARHHWLDRSGNHRRQSLSCRRARFTNATVCRCLDYHGCVFAGSPSHATAKRRWELQRA